MNDRPPRGKTLMIQGTSSSAGKSLLVAALCRCFARRGVRVAPFKSQNMSNNAAVCEDGAEIGRSQALQAIAAKVKPHADMNPILLKPEGDTHSQVIINGRAFQSLGASEYFKRKGQFWNVVTRAIDRLRDRYDLVVIEGAGSPAELNLVDVEIVNMAVARYCQSPVVLVGDIERGGVFAQLLGTLWLLSPEERSLVKGLIVNKFRGDLRLFDRGVEILQQRGETPVLGVMPWIKDLKLPEEDAVALLDRTNANDSNTDSADSRLDVVVIRFPHIANFDDFDPLDSNPHIRLRYVESVGQLGSPSVIILPGTKNTIADLQWLRQSGLADVIVAAAGRNVPIVGICGGYQMLGQRIDNPHGLESASISSVAGLQLLDVITTFQSQDQKQTYQVTAHVLNDSVVSPCTDLLLSGYEIHVGHTETNSPWLKLLRTGAGDAASVLDGARSSCGNIWGCYLHGIFHNDAFRSRWLHSLGADTAGMPNARSMIETSLDRLADVFESHIDIENLTRMIWSQE